MHGKVSRIRHDGRGVFARTTRRLRRDALPLARRSSATRCPRASKSRAQSEDGEIMGAAPSRARRSKGVQFHPEAMLTEHGHDMLENFSEGRCHEADHDRRSDPAHRRAPRGVPRRDAARHAPDHARRAQPGADRGLHHRAARQEGDDRRDRGRGAGDARIRHAGGGGRRPRTWWTPAAPAATPHTPSTCRPAQPSSPLRRAPRWRSTAAARCRPPRAAPTCSRRSARTSR